MHAAMRRMPVERVRHAKRLGRVESLPNIAAIDSITTTTTTTQQTPTSSQTTLVSTSSAQSPTSAPSSTAPTSSTSSTSSSATTSSSLSLLATSSTSTQLPTPTTLSSPVVTQTTVLTSTYPTPSPTSQSHSSAVTSSGLSGGAIAGIIAGAVIIGVALIVFFVRKTYLRRRERKRISWDRAPGLGAGSDDEPKFPDTIGRSASFASTPQRDAPLSPFEAHGQSFHTMPVAPAVRMQPSTFIVPTAPPATYNNLTPVAGYHTQPGPSPYGPGYAVGRAPVGMHSTLPSVRAQHAPVQVTVKCTFVPTLPDELSITTGERIFIIERYDDGWNLCANGRGEQGMVPHECLEHVSSDQPSMGWRNVRRLSSLNPDGQRF